MTESIRKLERDRIRADLASVNALVDQLKDEDVMSLESRRNELLSSIAAMDKDEIGTAVASAALFFGGRPVVGSHGIETEFGGEAIAKFQDLVAKLLASHETGGLGQRGIVPSQGRFDSSRHQRCSRFVWFSLRTDRATGRVGRYSTQSCSG